ncbi:SGNH hydrolase-type esterase domain-containing protein [Apiospora arundinis]
MATTQKKPAKKTPLRILCLGDSLTAGYPDDHPYAHKLKEVLEATDPRLAVETAVDGRPGDQVADGTFRRRMQMRWAEDEYDWTIVLGGTNDLAWNVPGRKVLEALQNCWDIPLSKGGKVLALTIPDCEHQGASIGDRRTSVNRAIKTHKQRNFYTYDLFEALPFHNMDPDERYTVWNFDGLHLDAAGYDLMGQKVAEALLKIIQLEEAQNTEISSIVTDARQRRMIEDMIFEEERGDPKLLSQGYIVVRKADLD